MFEVKKNKIIHPDFRESAQEQALIFNKQWYFYVEYPVELLFENQLLDTLMHAYHVSRPLEQFFNQFIQTK